MPDPEPSLWTPFLYLDLGTGLSKLHCQTHCALNYKVCEFSAYSNATSQCYLGTFSDDSLPKLVFAGDPAEFELFGMPWCKL